jgi:hypothetical protein
MANGLLAELRRLAESSKDVPQEVVNRLILGALAEVVDRLDKVTDTENVNRDAVSTSLDDLCDKYDRLAQTVASMDSKLSSITGDLTVIKSNPFVSLGAFIKRHPKIAFFSAILGGAASIILLTSKPFLILVLSLTGVPKEVIEQLLTLMF